jgi:hypothetical protein
VAGQRRISDAQETELRGEDVSFLELAVLSSIVANDNDHPLPSNSMPTRVELPSWLRRAAVTMKHVGMPPGRLVQLDDRADPLA